MESNKITTYDDLTTEQKADFIAELLDTGWNDYFDNCKKLKDGRYEYYNAASEEITIYTAAEIVREAEEWAKDEIAEHWEEHK